MAVEVNESTFETEVIGSEGKVIVDFWAEWCGPCHAVAPVLDRIADERDLKIVKVNIDHEQGLAQRYGVSSIPMMMLFEGGEPQASVVGAYAEGCARARARAQRRGARRGMRAASLRGRHVVQVAQEGEVLGEVLLDRLDAVPPLVDPALAEVVLDQVEGFALIHGRDHPGCSS